MPTKLLIFLYRAPSPASLFFFLRQSPLPPPPMKSFFVLTEVSSPPFRFFVVDISCAQLPIPLFVFSNLFPPASSVRLILSCFQLVKPQTGWIPPFPWALRSWADPLLFSRARPVFFFSVFFLRPPIPINALSPFLNPSSRSPTVPANHVLFALFPFLQTNFGLLHLLFF